MTETKLAKASDSMQANVECPSCGKVLTYDTYISDNEQFYCPNPECKVSISIDMTYEEPDEPEEEEEEPEGEEK